MLFSALMAGPGSLDSVGAANKVAMPPRSQLGCLFVAGSPPALTELRARPPRFVRLIRDFGKTFRDAQVSFAND